MCFSIENSGQSGASLKRDPKTKLYQTTVSLELAQAGTDRVLLASRIGGTTAREELPGNLRELSAELWSYKNLSATTVRGTEMELCRFQGKPISVLVPVLAIADTSADPNSVTVSGQSESSESSVTLSWEVSASQSGLAQFSRAGSPIMLLKRQPQTKLYGVSAALELTRLDADRVLFVRRIGQHTLREEIAGNFRELADELLRTKTMSAKTVSGTTVELCQFQGKPFTVQVHVQTSTATTPADVDVASWSFPMVGVGVIGLCLIAGIVLIIIRVLKGGTAGKVVLLLVSLPVFLLTIVLTWYLTARTGLVREELLRAKVAAAQQQAIGGKGAATSRPKATPLVRREVKEKARDGRDIVMIFEELQRDEKTSTVRIKSVGGGSVGSAMFEVRGNYDIAKARGAACFINLKGWEGEDGAWMYHIGFAPNKNVDPETYFNLKEPLPADKRHQFLTVEDYEHLVKRQP